MKATRHGAHRARPLARPLPLALLGLVAVANAACGDHATSDGSGTHTSAGASGSPSGGATSAGRSTGGHAGATSGAGNAGAPSGGAGSGSGATGGGGSDSGAGSGAGGAATGGASAGSPSGGASAGTANVSGAGGVAAAGGAGAGGTGGGNPPPGPGYFVSPDGSDDAAGTVDAPFRTLGKAQSVVRTVNAAMSDDIHVYLRGGVHRLTTTLTFGPPDSGMNGHRVRYEAYPGETPIVSGAVPVTGWMPDTGGVYRASLARTTKLRNLYVNDTRAAMTSKKVTGRGDYGTYSVTQGQASWAWVSGSKADGAKYDTSAVPDIASNKDDLEIVNGTTWNENIVCVRDVITTSDNYRALLFQEPYGAIAQVPGWGAAFTTTGSHTIYNAREFLNGPGQFYFDKTTQTLYYYPRTGEDMAKAAVEAPVLETLVALTGTSTTAHVKNITFQGIVFAHTDYALADVAGSHGKASCQAADAFIAFGDTDWHADKYEIADTLPGIVMANNADSLDFVGDVFEHGGSDGLSLINDVVGTHVTGNFITDIAGSGITVGHPQHIYIGDGGAHEKYPAGIEGVCAQNAITNNVIYDVSVQPGFGGHAGITAFFVDTLSITHNHIQKTAYNGINLGWGWRNFKDSKTCKNNAVNGNRLIDTLNRLHDSGAVYTIGQMPGTTINQNYVKGIPPATSGPTYGLHNDEGSAYITEDDNVLDIDPGVKYTINCEDYGEKHDLTILRTYATVNKMGVTPPMSTIDPPVVVSDNVWALAQYTTAVSSGVEDAYQALIPSAILADADAVFPASYAAVLGSGNVTVRKTRSPASVIWFAPASTTAFAEGPTMTRAAGDAGAIALPANAGTYKLFVLDAQGTKLGESSAILRVK